MFANCDVASPKLNLNRIHTGTGKRIWCEPMPFIATIRQQLEQVDNPAVAMRAVEQMLQSFAESDLKYSVYALLQDDVSLAAVAARSYLHGNGFYKLVLSTQSAIKLRMHVWLPGTNAEENIHEHRWHFASIVLAGQLHSEIYQEASHPRAKEYREFLYRVGNKAAKPDLLENGHTRLVCTSSSLLVRGDSYVLDPGTLHRIVSSSGGELTATLMCQAAPARQWNRLITTNDSLLPEVSPRYLSVDELVYVLKQFLDCVAYT